MAAQCIVCRRNGESTYPVGERETYRLHTDCRTCGSYESKGDLWEYLKSLTEAEADFPLLPYVSAHVRQATDAGEVVLLTADNWRELARAHADTPVAEKLRKILEYVAKRTPIGEWYYLMDDGRLAAAGDVRDDVELKFVLTHLHDRHLVTYQPAMPPPPARRHADGGYDQPEAGIRLSVDGWTAVAPIAGGIAGTCFVAMSFDPSLDSAYHDGIQLALSDAGYRAVRVDRDPHNESITDRIIAAIRAAQFLVADFTFQRQGVYYEAGFAQGLGRTVIRTCRHDDFGNLHFDVRQFFHLKWSTPSDLRAALRDHVLATIGRPGART